jgi:tetratricopeptide (TPR) repeat protein
MPCRASSQRAPEVIGLCLAAALVAGGLDAQEAESPLATFQQAIEDAQRSVQIGEVQIAESRYRTALYEGWILLGSLAETSGDLLGGRAAYETAIGSAVAVRRARLSLAMVLARMGEYDEAEAALRLLIAQDKNDFEARRLLADTLTEAGRHEEGVQELEQLVYLNRENLENFYYLATAYLGLGRPEEADQLLSEIAEMIPTPQTHILIGRTYRDADYWERARRAFEIALELDPQVHRAHYYLGTVDLLDQGWELLESAKAHFENELHVNPEDEMASLYLGICLTEQRRYHEAIHHLEIASRLPPARADALRLLGRSLAELGRTDEAIAAFRRGLEAVEVDVADRAREEISENQARQISSLHFQLANALRRSGDREAANVHFDAAKQFQARSTESARDTLDRYLANEPEGLGSRESQTSLAGHGDLGASQMMALKSSITGTLARAYLDLGVLKVRADEARQAAGFFEQALALDPGMPDIHYSLGVARFNAGQFEDAAEPLSRALEGRPTDANLRQMLALARFNSDEYEAAAELMSELPERAANPGLQYAYGLALVRSGQAGKAEEIFLELLQRNAESPELNVVLGQAFAQQGDFDESIRSLQYAITLDPEVAEAHGTLGEIHLRRGELEQAEEALRAELRIRPDDAHTMFTLATVLDLAQKPEEAKTLLQLLLDADPYLAKGRYLLGKILLAQGSLEDAREQLEAAAGLSPEDANTHYQLGQAYQKLGRRDEARAQFDIFRQLKNERR